MKKNLVKMMMGPRSPGGTRYERPDQAKNVSNMFGGVFDSSGKINKYGAQYLFAMGFLSLSEEPYEKTTPNPLGGMFGAAGSKVEGEGAEGGT